MNTANRVPRWNTFLRVSPGRGLLPMVLVLLGLAAYSGGGNGGGGGGDTARPRANVQAADTVPVAAQSTLRRVVSPGAAGGLRK
jgi:hypothetical protein